MKKCKQIKLGDMIACYETCEETGAIGLCLIPSDKLDDYHLREELPVDSLVQIKLVGDDYGKKFSHGHSLRNSQTTQNLSFIDQIVSETTVEIKIETHLKDKRDNDIIHTLIWDKNYQVIELKSRFINRQAEVVKLELFSSFSLSGISPFSEKVQANSLFLNRLRSKWSMEGRIQRQSIEELQLEPSWKPSGAGIEKFGQLGSMPVRGYFPYICVEDTANNTAWGVQLGLPSSWQIEAYRNDDDLCLTGGIADRDYGHWLKTVNPEESFETPSAIVTVSQGDMTNVSQRLVDYQEKSWQVMTTKTEEELPIIFNEFCTSWGEPTEENILRLMESVANRGITYFVIDAGWYADEDLGWEQHMGDWVVNQKQFPSGLKSVAAKVRQAGMIPGIWFEIELCGRSSKAFQLTEHLLSKDGYPITTGERRFWDMRDSWVQEYLSERVIKQLEDNDFGYLKIDYNDNIGIGIDHPESLGEGLREQMEASLSFFERIHDTMPDLVIENCASGGHRLVSSYVSRTNMSSFSDAHEAVSIPIIAANLHWVMLPKQSQIWAVLRKEDNARRLYYSMVSTFLGRMCLSGDVDKLDDKQWAIVDQGIEFYKQVSPIIAEGDTHRFGKPVENYTNPDGYQGVVRYDKEGKQALVVIHFFEHDGEAIKIPLSSGKWEILKSYGDLELEIQLEAEACLTVKPTDNYQAIVLHLENNI